MKFKLNLKYLCAFVAVFIIEAFIAIFVRDNFIRPYLGDVLVVILIYCFIRSFVYIKGRLLPLYIFIFAVAVELGQYFNVVQLLGLGSNRIARIVFGTSFDMKDIACYLVGCLCLWLFEVMSRRRKQT